jgi:hypothetical protein
MYPHIAFRPCWVVLALVILLAGRAPAAIYYVDPTAGSDSNSGRSPEAAWRSLEKINATVFKPGDRILLKSGSAWTGRLHPLGSGTPGKPIVLDRYGRGRRPLIEGGGVSGGAVALEDQQYWSIRNLEVTNHGSAEPRKIGIQVLNNCAGALSGIEVRGCEIHQVDGVLEQYADGKASGAIVFSVTARDLARPSFWNDIRIEDNTIHDVAREGILLQSLWVNKPADPNSNWKGLGPYTPSTNVYISGNTLERIGGDGIIPWCVKGAVIEHNLVRQANNNSVKQGHVAIWPYFCEDVVFQFNEVCETRTKYDGMAFDFDNSDRNCIYQYNYSHDNEGGFLNMCCDGNGNGDIARYNISQNDGCIAGSRVFLVHGNGNHNYHIYNNTVYVHNGDPQVFEQDGDCNGSSILFTNNLFINNGKGSFITPKGCRFERNLYSGAGQAADPEALLDDARLVAVGTGGMGLDSVGGYRLRADSPAVGAGRLIPRSGGRDLWGNPVPAGKAPNVGAYNGRPVKQK